MPLARLTHHDTAKHGYSGAMKESTGEWNGVLLSSVMRVGSVCMRVMDVHMYGLDLVSVIFWSAFAHNPQVPSQAISYNSQSHLVFLQGKVNCACYIAQVVNPVLLPFLRQEDDVLFSRTTYVHICGCYDVTSSLWCTTVLARKSPRSITN